MSVAALDLGATGCRTYIFDLVGIIIASGYQEWQIFYPFLSFVEQDTCVWWNSLKKPIERGIKKSGIDTTEVYFKQVGNN